MPSMSNRPVTVLGLGSMGSALARAFVADAHPTTVWNRTSEKAEPLVSMGARAADSVEEAVAASPLVITCLTGFDETRDVLARAAPSLQNRDLVTLNSGSPAGARRMASWASGHGARLLAGAIQDVPEAIGDTAVLHYSGDAIVFDAHRQTLRALGEAVHVGDEPDIAALYELAAGGVLLPAMLGFFQGAAVMQARGRTAASLVPSVERSLEVVKALLHGLAARIDRRDYNDAANPVDLYLSLEQAEHDLGRETGVDVAWQAPAWDRLRKATELGYGNQDIAVVTEVLRDARAWDTADRAN